MTPRTTCLVLSVTLLGGLTAIVPAAAEPGPDSPICAKSTIGNGYGIGVDPDFGTGSIRVDEYFKVGHAWQYVCAVAAMILKCMKEDVCTDFASSKAHEWGAYDGDALVLVTPFDSSGVPGVPYTLTCDQVIDAFYQA